MLRDVDHDKIVNALKEAYAENNYSDTGKIGQALSAFKTDLKKRTPTSRSPYDSTGKTTTFSVGGGGGTVTVPGVDFMKGTWSIWFGKIESAVARRRDNSALVEQRETAHRAFSPRARGGTSSVSTTSGSAPARRASARAASAILARSAAGQRCFAAGKNGGRESVGHLSVVVHFEHRFVAALGERGQHCVGLGVGPPERDGYVLSRQHAALVSSEREEGLRTHVFRRAHSHPLGR